MQGLKDKESQTEDAHQPEAKKQKVDDNSETPVETNSMEIDEAEEAAAMLAAAAENMDACENSPAPPVDTPFSSDQKGGISKLKAFAFSSKT